MTHAPPSLIECWHARIRGRVQGVGYRASCSRRARQLGLVGWVRNRTDGSVEAVIVGPPERLETMRAWLHRGPPSAWVESVEVTTATLPDPPYSGFEQRPTT